VEHAARTTIERAGTALASRRERLAPDRIRDTFTRESDGVSSRLDEVQTRARAALRLATSELSRRHAKLEAADPARILRRGFTLTRDPSGAILRDPLRLREGDELVTQFSEGSARSRVVEERR
jgi:exonuclease VII large subunit